MQSYHVKLIDKYEAANNTLVFSFERPDGYEFIAGQFADFTLINPDKTDAKGHTRAFSITSAPYDKAVITIATRIRESAFKENLCQMMPGSSIALSEAMGFFTLHSNIAKPAVFLTGGIGITPVRSIILQSAQDNIRQPIFVFYSNYRPEDAAFLDELYQN